MSMLRGGASEVISVAANPLWLCVGHTCSTAQPPLHVYEIASFSVEICRAKLHWRRANEVAERTAAIQSITRPP